MAIHSPNFYSGPCMTPTLVALAALSVIFTFTATALHRCGALRLTPRQQTATRVSIKGSLIGSCLAIGLARFLDLRAAGHRSPAIPAAGAAASWAAALALVPVPKAMNPGRLLFGSGYERTIPYHTFMGNFIMFAGMVHGCLCVAQKRASMAAAAAASSASTALVVAPTIAAATSTTAASSLSATILAKIAKLPQSNLSGFISFLSFILIVLSSRKWIRRKFFATWRALHVSLTGSAYFFLVVHDPKTISLMLPVVAYYAADVVLRVVMSVLANAKVVAIVAHEDAQVVEVKIKLYGLVPALMVETNNTASSSSPESHEGVSAVVEPSHAQPQPQPGGRTRELEVGEEQGEEKTLSQRVLQRVGRVLFPQLAAGDFVHLGFLTRAHPELWAAHPLTVASYDHSERTATFFVKALGPWSNALLRIASSPTTTDAKASSTNAPTEAPSDVDVAAGGGHPPSSLLGVTVSWVGPCGSLQVPLDSVPNHLLVCGGVGITPMLAILEALAAEKTKDEETTGTRAMATRTTASSPPVMETGKGRAVLVWSVRGLELPTALWLTLSALATAADVQVRVFDTTPMTPPAGTAASSPTTRMMHRNSAKGKVTETPALVSRSERRTAHLVSRAGHSSQATPATTPLHTHTGEADSGTQRNKCRGDGEEYQTVEQKIRSVATMGRPDIAQILREEFSAPCVAQAPAAPTSPESATGADAATGACPWTTARPAVTSPPSVPVVGLYCCGPQGMAKQCIAAATARGSTFVHNEQF